MSAQDTLGPISKVHMTPLDGDARTQCCGRSVYALPAPDRVTSRYRLVTCSRPPKRPRVWTRAWRWLRGEQWITWTVIDRATLVSADWGSDPPVIGFRSAESHEECGWRRRPRRNR